MSDIPEEPIEPIEPAVGDFDYIVDDIRPLIKQWDATLSDETDLTDCDINGAIYTKTLAELKEALMAVSYNPDSLTTPIAWQRCHDLLTLGISLYFIEGRTMVAYQDGYNPINSAFSRYRNALRDIAAGGQLGEFNNKAKVHTGAFHRVRRWR